MNENIRLDDSTVFNPQTGEFGTLPQILLFSSDKNILSDERPAIINWTVSNATAIKLNNETVEPTGTKEFYSTELLTITLYASNDVGAAEPKTITIDIDRQAPIIHSFKIDVPFAVKGTPITLTWSIEGAKKIEVDNGVGDVSMQISKIVTLGSNGVFNLTAKNYFGIKTEAQVAVSIFPIPIIEGIFIPKPQFNVQAISLNQPTFNLQTTVFNNIVITQPTFTQLDKLGSKILFNKRTLNSILFSNNIFKLLTDKQKEISYIVKSLWKKETRKKLKQTLRQN